MEEILAPEIASLLIEFNKDGTERKGLFWKEWNEKIERIERQMSADSGNLQTFPNKEYWRSNESIARDLYKFLYENCPVKIPSCLFFTFKDEDYVNKKMLYVNKKMTADLADKWLKDIFSGESFYKRNKEYFTKVEVKYFFDRADNWQPDNIAQLSCERFIGNFFNTKMFANKLIFFPLFSYAPFLDLGDCFVHEIVIEYIKFLCNNKKYLYLLYKDIDKDIDWNVIREKAIEMREISKFLKDEYISTGKNINFLNHTYHSLKRLCDEWYISKMVKSSYVTRILIDKSFYEKRLRENRRYKDELYEKKLYEAELREKGLCEHKIMQDYIIFICKKVKNIRDKWREIDDICDFLRTEYIDKGQDFNFENMTWQGLKRMSNEWHISNILKEKFHDCFDHKIVQDCIIFIKKNMERIGNRKREIGDICDFLKTEYVDNGQDFNFENMTWQELKRLSDEWHLEFRERADRAYRERNEKILNTEWEKSSIKDFIYEKEGKTWTIKEITTGRSLYEEGDDMEHCVFSYANDCIRGNRYIFSLRCKSIVDDEEKRVATVEISSDMKFTQARGQGNANIDNETANIIKIWADENGIDCGNNFVR